jgi:hypothetical protein
MIDELVEIVGDAKIHQGRTVSISVCQLFDSSHSVW